MIHSKQEHVGHHQLVDHIFAILKRRTVHHSDTIHLELFSNEMGHHSDRAIGTDALHATIAHAKFSQFARRDLSGHVCRHRAILVVPQDDHRRVLTHGIGRR